MNTTASDLVQCCLRDEFPSSFSTIVDYFNDIEDNNIFSILFGVYVGLVIKKGVEAELLHKCLIIYVSNVWE